MQDGVMRREPPLPPELWEQIPAASQAALLVLSENYERRIGAREAEVAGLKEQLQQNSQNSSRPPSTDGPHVKRTPPRERSGRKRGAQPGHPRYERTFVPLAQVKEGIACKPPQWRRCGEALRGADPQPRRHQVVEVPPVVVEVRESQRHRLVCGQCGLSTCGTVPAGVPLSGSGPRLSRIVALCTGRIGCASG